MNKNPTPRTGPPTSDRKASTEKACKPQESKRNALRDNLERIRDSVILVMTKERLAKMDNSVENHTGTIATTAAIIAATSGLKLEDVGQRAKAIKTACDVVIESSLALGRAISDAEKKGYDRALAKEEARVERAYSHLAGVSEWAKSFEGDQLLTMPEKSGPYTFEKVLTFIFPNLKGQRRISRFRSWLKAREKYLPSKNPISEYQFYRSKAYSLKEYVTLAREEDQCRKKAKESEFHLDDEVDEKVTL